jgi:hypothetical protein
MAAEIELFIIIFNCLVVNGIIFPVVGVLLSIFLFSWENLFDMG